MRPSKACLQCRTGKRRCDIEGMLGCNQCIQRNLQCSAAGCLPVHRTPQRISPQPASPSPTQFDEDAIELVDLYFRYMHDKPHSILHEATFRHDFAKKTAGRQVLLSMVGLSARFSVNPQVQSRGKRYAEEAKTVFKRNLEQPSVENIQASILIGNSCRGESDPEAESLYFALANRMAQLLRIWEVNEADDGVARETKLRLWWTCQILDTWASGGSGLSRQMRPALKRPRVPMDEFVFYNMRTGDPDIPDSEWKPGLWGHMVNLVEIYMQIQDLHKDLAEMTEWDEDIMEDTVCRLDAQLVAFESNLEPHVRYSRDNLANHISRGLGSVFIAFHIGFFHYFTLLFYQYLDSRRPLRTNGKEYASRCKYYAAMVCEVLAASREYRGAEALYNIVGHVTVVSSSVLLHTYLFGDPHELPQCRRNLESNLESLIQLRSYWPSVELMINRLVIFQNSCIRSFNFNIYRFDRWMVKFLIQHASELEEKASDATIGDAQVLFGAASNDVHLERIGFTRSIMRGIQNGETSNFAAEES